METYVDGYIGKRSFGTDAETGLTIEVRCTNCNINAKTKEIQLIFEKVLVSPTGIAMFVSESVSYLRFDDVQNNLLRYTQQQQSEIGLAMKYVIETMDLSKIASDLSNFPHCLEQGYVEPE